MKEIKNACIVQDELVLCESLWDILYTRINMDFNIIILLFSLVRVSRWASRAVL